jgi:hypothetical protein
MGSASAGRALVIGGTLSGLFAALLLQRRGWQLFMHLAFCLPNGEQMLGYPVAGPNNDLRPGHRRYNLVWYRPANQRTVCYSACNF